MRFSPIKLIPVLALCWAFPAAAESTTGGDEFAEVLFELRHGLGIAGLTVGRNLVGDGLEQLRDESSLPGIERCRHIRYHALLVSLVPAVSYRSTKSALLFCCQQSSLLSVQTGRSSP